MTPSTRRLVIPIVVLGLAAGVVLSVVFRREAVDEASPAASTPAETTAQAAGETPPPEAAGVEPDQTPSDQPPSDQTTPPSDSLSTTGGEPRGSLRATRPDPAATPDESWLTIGSLDPGVASLQLELMPAGAGIRRIVLSDQWETARVRRQADAHYQAVQEGAIQPPPLPDETLRYVLTEAHGLGQFVIPVLAAQAITIDDQDVDLLLSPEGPVEWATIGPGQFEIVIEDEQQRPIARLERSFAVGDMGEILLRQGVENLTDAAITVKLKQWGPNDLIPDRSRYMDRRRFRFGYLQPAQRDPSRRLVFAEPKLMVERADAFKQDDFLLWPNDIGRDRGYVLSWFASTNRYFALAIHPLISDPEQDSLELTSVVQEIGKVTAGDSADSGTIFTQLFSPARTVPAGGRTAFDMGVFAGPQDRSILAAVQPFKTLSMDRLILYQMSSCCAVCTFQWLAQFLMVFLSLVESVVRDWGIAIIVLVCFVRLLLHPLTKRAQINMHRFSKSMTSMKPELERLQKKYKDEPKKFQAEQIRLMREHGVSPMQFLGCLPMFLQTPIWIALYAMLYFAFEIRQVPAFYGIFQKISGGGWPFLADLSASDHFFGEFSEPASFLFWNVTGINILPILMGGIFFIQQKYMSPPPSPTMTKEQIQQQKIMKIMMVVMFPLMLYSAPSGLTLYILTSSCIGILESRHVRKHVNEMDDKPAEEKTAKKSRSRDAMGRAYAAAIERAEAKRRARQQPAKKTYKKKKK